MARDTPARAATSASASGSPAGPGQRRASARGGRYRIVGTLLGRTIQSSYQVTAFEPGRSFEGTMTSPMFGFSEQYRFEPDGQATRVSMTATAEPHGAFRFLAPVMTAGIRRQVRADHRRLKTFLEQPGTQAASGSAD